MEQDPNRLTEEQAQKVAKWFAEKSAGGVVGKCPMCGTREWFLIQHMVHAPVFAEGGGIMMGGTQYPMIMLTCKNCGNTQMHSAVMMGLVKSSEEQTRERDAKAHGDG